LEGVRAILIVVLKVFRLVLSLLFKVMKKDCFLKRKS